MKLKLLQDYTDKHKAGELIEIDNLMRRRDCGSGVMVRVVGMNKNPVWLDLGWFIPDPESRPTKRAVGRVARVRPVKSKSKVATRR